MKQWRRGCWKVKIGQRDVSVWLSSFPCHTPPPLSYFSRLLAFRRLRSLPLSLLMMPRVCEVRLFGSCLSARASVLPPPVCSQIPNRLSKSCLKQEHNFYVLSCKKRRDAKTDKRRRNPCLVVGCLTAPEQAHKKHNKLCVHPKESLVMHV